MFKKQVKKSDIARQYASFPSFADFLPWLEWSDEKDMVILEDMRSVGALFEVKSVPTEARGQDRINDLHKQIMRLLSTMLPLEDKNPWVMQIFIQDELTLEPAYKVLKDYIAAHGSLDDPLAKKYLSVMRDHFEKMSQSKGILIDPMSDIPFRGKIRRVRIALYRRYEKLEAITPQSIVNELENVCAKFETQIRQMGLRIRRLKASHFYEWLVRWFNPNPKKTSGNVEMLLKKNPYPKGRKPFGWSMTQNIFFGSVVSDDQGWQFDEMPHKVLLIKELDREVAIGAISREMEISQDKKYAALDKFPPGSIYTIQVTFESKDSVHKHLDKIENSAIGRSGVAKEIGSNVMRARNEIDRNNMLFRSVEAIYLRGENEAELVKYEMGLQTLLDSIGLSIIDSKNEIFPKDLYLQCLPFNFSYAFDKKKSFRSTYKYADDIARLLPIYGRSDGDGINPLHIYYNRGGEAFIFDHLSNQFKMSNSHMAIVGTTGAGKSVSLNNMIMAMSAVRNPRIIAMEVGGSFDLMAKFLKKYGRDVKVLKFDRTQPFAVNPYAESHKALDMIEREEAAIKAYESRDTLGIVTESHADKINQVLEDRTNGGDVTPEEDRDILNEMVLATRVMITQGSPKEEEKMDPTDMGLITHALILAMKKAHQDGKAQMLLMDVIASMRLLAEKEASPRIKGRLTDFALRLDYYTKGVRGQFVNRPSIPLDDFDFLHIDFGFMQSESYKDLLNIVCISLLGKVLALAEANKASGRPTELIMDEAHVLFKSAMVASFVILMAKVSRKIGLWMKPCTQNIEDFTGIESKKVLSMMETWLCLALEADEVSLIEKFKPLSSEVRSLILDVRKYPGIYSEGVLLGKRFAGLFRNIPPRIALALAMTEQDERTERKQIQKERGICELEAVEQMANAINTKKFEVNDEKYFRD